MDKLADPYVVGGQKRENEILLKETFFQMKKLCDKVLPTKNFLWEKVAF